MAGRSVVEYCFSTDPPWVCDAIDCTSCGIQLNVEKMCQLQDGFLPTRICIYLYSAREEDSDDSVANLFRSDRTIDGDSGTSLNGDSIDEHENIVRAAYELGNAAAAADVTWNQEKVIDEKEHPDELSDSLVLETEIVAVEEMVTANASDNVAYKPHGDSEEKIEKSLATPEYGREKTHLSSAVHNGSSEVELLWQTENVHPLVGDSAATGDEETRQMITSAEEVNANKNANGDAAKNESVRARPKKPSNARESSATTTRLEPVLLQRTVGQEISNVATSAESDLPQKNGMTISPVRATLVESMIFADVRGGLSNTAGTAMTGDTDDLCLPGHVRQTSLIVDVVSCGLSEDRKSVTPPARNVLTVGPAISQRTSAQSKVARDGLASRRSGSAAENRHRHSTPQGTNTLYRATSLFNLSGNLKIQEELVEQVQREEEYRRVHARVAHTGVGINPSNYQEAKASRSRLHEPTRVPCP